ncbi:MAG: sigma-E processing peptidase SpoIIGA [Oscillospiraceae bacterium]|nr:sigma-E processing peptidase SpoIIGA [Oscillospiraceae bacterium]
MAGYAMGVMSLATIVQWLLLTGTNRLSRMPSRRPLVLLSAVIGGVYTGMCLLPQWSFWSKTSCHFAVLVLLGVVSFGISVSAWQRTAVYILLNMALEGIAAGFGGVDYWRYTPAVGMLWVLCTVGFLNKPSAGRYIPMELSYAGKSMTVTALEDTGNFLTDPLTGQQVLVVNANVAASIAGLTKKQLQSPLDTLKSVQIPGLRLIPYKTVGQSGNFLLALRMQVKVNKQVEHYLVAFAPEMFGKEEIYQALAGGLTQ